jgi:(S)-2-hydroxy-acid oxidase
MSKPSTGRPHRYLILSINVVRLKIRPMTLRNVAHIDTSTKVFGKTYPYPIAISPSAMQRLAHPDGELGTSRAAASQGTTMTLSTFSNTSLEDVIKAGREVKRAEGIPAPDYWLQLYCFQNREASERLIQRAEAAGYKAVVLTVDTPYLGKRYNEIRNKFVLPPHIRLGNFVEEEKVKVFGEKVTLERVAEKVSEQGVKPAKSKIGGPIPGPLKNENGITQTVIN